ncbi:MAG: hypothetical protein ACNI3C_11700 [Candidatus Marinarcus sp.]|uniref:hypothetical protein n=1 Tax=Candidatus Marinarcus sp. TaxID=3100987 RepID=UPI003B00AF2B
MWFIFGFISLFNFIMYFIYILPKKSWKGIDETYNDISYKYKIISHKGKVMRLLLGINGIEGYDYSLKKENSIDRFFKRIRISYEFQSGNIEFDDSIYIISDDTYLHHQLSKNQEITNIILKILSFDNTYNCKIMQIHNKVGQLWIEFKPSKEFDRNIISKISSQFIPLLVNFNNELNIKFRGQDT